jgi:hypothetical protein
MHMHGEKILPRRKFKIWAGLISPGLILSLHTVVLSCSFLLILSFISAPLCLLCAWRPAWALGCVMVELWWRGWHMGRRLCHGRATSWHRMTCCTRTSPSVRRSPSMRCCGCHDPRPPPPRPRWWRQWSASWASPRASTIVGNAFMHGVYDGKHKRVSIGHVRAWLHRCCTAHHHAGCARVEGADGGGVGAPAIQVRAPPRQQWHGSMAAGSNLGPMGLDLGSAVFFILKIDVWCRQT